MGCCGSKCLATSSQSENDLLLPVNPPYNEPERPHYGAVTMIVAKETLDRVVERTAENLINIGATEQKHLTVDGSERASEYRELLSGLTPALPTPPRLVPLEPCEAPMGVTEEEAAWMAKALEEVHQALQRVEVKNVESVVVPLSWC
ncbi:uncharacterized protein VTP21DRAFT_6501 [Calcarisporiella thermophila]|uniref:uncharacterized protein n=1 Tax=Calcarisporiella thermophila TaxID=911321 RepID=UPI0037436158